MSQQQFYYSNNDTWSVSVYPYIWSGPRGLLQHKDHFSWLRYSHHKDKMVKGLYDVMGNLIPVRTQIIQRCYLSKHVTSWHGNTFHITVENLLVTSKCSHQSRLDSLHKGSVTWSFSCFLCCNAWWNFQWFQMPYSSCCITEIGVNIHFP